MTRKAETAIRLARNLDALVENSVTLLDYCADRLYLCQVRRRRTRKPTATTTMISTTTAETR